MVSPFSYYSHPNHLLYSNEFISTHSKATYIIKSADKKIFEKGQLNRQKKNIKYITTNT